MTVDDLINKPNPYRAGSVMHWYVFMYKKHKGDLSNLERTKHNFQVVPSAPPENWGDDYRFNYSGRRTKWNQALREMVKDVCAEDDVLVLDHYVMFTRETDAVLFKLKASELLSGN